MKICVIGAPSTGKSIFAKKLAADLGHQGLSCELVQEYASSYIQNVGAPSHAWEQLVISVGQYLSEQKTKREIMITDAAAFATYIYAQKSLPSNVSDDDWPKFQNLLDLLRNLARISLQSYDLVLLMAHVFEPKADGVRLQDHLSREQCEEINTSLKDYLDSERASYIEIDARKDSAIPETSTLIAEQLKAHA